MKKLVQHIMGSHGSEGQLWFSQLPVLVQNLADKWQLSELVAFENLSWNYVARARREGRPVVLKLSFDLPSIEREWQAMRCFTSDFVVGALEFDVGSKALLLSAAEPGSDLTLLQPNDPFEALKICCEVAMGLQKNQKPTGFALPNIAAEFANLEKTWRLSEEVLQLARRLKRELISEPKMAESLIIHGDLHRGNILLHHEKGNTSSKWLAIDPKGFQGQLVNEVWSFIHDPAVEVPWVAKYLNLKEDVLLKWCFLHAVLAATWCLEDRVDPKNVLELVEKARVLLK